MRKSILFVLVAALCVAAFGEEVHKVCGQVNFTLQNGKLTITPSHTVRPPTYNVVISTNCLDEKYKPYIKNMEIDVGISEINFGVFQGLPHLETVKLGANLSAIGGNAFKDCVKLSQVTKTNEPANIPQWVSLGNSAFEGCYSLQNLGTVNISSLGPNTFKGCSSLTTVTIASPVLSFPASCFEGCTKLATVTTNTDKNFYRIGSIGSRAFKYCTSLKSLPIGPDPKDVSMTLIGEQAFYGSGLTGEVKLPNYTASNPLVISENAFAECVALTKITFTSDSSVAIDIGNYAFKGTSSLETVVIPKTVKKIGTGAFYRSGIKGLSFDGDANAQPVEIGDYAFSRCEKLGKDQNVDISCRVTSIGLYAFHACGDLKNLKLPDNCGEKDPFVRIREYAFSSCHDLKELTVTKYIFELRGHVFEDCEALEKVTFNDRAKPLGIGDYSFYECPKLASITFGKNITMIGSHAFHGCKSLEKVTIGESVTEIGTHAFHGCYKMTELTIPKSVVTIGDDAFHGCTKLKTLTLQEGEKDTEGVQVIGDYAFYGCYSLQKVNIPKTVKVIGAGAFYGCYGMTELTFSTIANATRMEIRKYAFFECKSLKKIDFGKSVSVLGEFAFARCRNLEEIRIRGDLEGYILPGAAGFYFAECPNLRKLTVYAEYTVRYRIPTHKNETVANVFSKWDTVKEVVVEGSVDRIGVQTFAQMMNLENVTINNGVQIIADGAFYNCRKLGKINFGEGDKLVNIGDGSTSTIGAFASCVSLEQVAIPKSVKVINHDAFSHCDKLNAVTFPQGQQIQTIGASAFSWDVSLEVINIPDTVEKILANAFSYCSKLKTLNFAAPSKVTSIGGGAFYNCVSLPKVVFPDSLEKIEDGTNGAFENCTVLNEVTFGNTDKASNFTRVGSRAFYNCTSLETITFKENSILNDLKGPVFTTFGDYSFFNCSKLKDFVVPKYLETVGSYAFKNCIRLTKFSLGEAVSSIGNNAFENCTGLTSMKFDNFVYSIGANAFYNCANLVEIDLGDRVTTIGAGAFCNTSLGKVKIPKTVTTLGGTSKSLGVFESCENLTEIEIGVSVSMIGWATFSGCVNLKKIVLPNSVTTIYGYAFANSGLASIDFGQGLTTIGRRAFVNCSGLGSITLPSTMERLGEQTCSDTDCGYTFANCSGLGNVTIEGNNLMQIAQGTFYRCVNLVSVKFLRSSAAGAAMLLGASAFEGCSSLVEVEASAASVIGDRTFFGCSSLTSFSFSVATSIGREAFSGCSSLATLVLRPTLTSIGALAFVGCSSLKAVTIPDSVTTLGDAVFANCSGLVNVTLGRHASIPLQLFANCSSLKNIVLGNTVGTISSYAFEGCSSLQKINIPESVTTIQSNAFKNCGNLEDVFIGRFIGALNQPVFPGCYKLKKIDIGEEDRDLYLKQIFFKSVDGVVFKYERTFNSSGYMTSGVVHLALFPNGKDGSYNLVKDKILEAGSFNKYQNVQSTFVIDQYAFYDVPYVESVTFDNITTVQTQAFYDCSKMKTATFTYGPITINKFAFTRCSGLTDINLGKEVKTIDNQAFIYLSSLMNINVVGDGDYYKSINGVLVTKRAGLFRYPEGRTGAYAIPDEIKTVEAYAFAFCYGLSSITFGKKVKYLRDNAFSYAYGLKNLVITEPVKTIGSYCFSHSSGNGYLDNAPRAYNLTSVVVGGSVSSVSSYAFFNISALTSVEFLTTVGSIGSSAFANCTNLASVKFDVSAVGRGYMSTIGASAFENCTKLTSIALPEGLVTLSDRAFYNDVNLNSVTFGSTLNSIGGEAFKWCNKLKSIVLGNGTQSLAIGNSAFSQCTSLTDVTFGKNTRSIGDTAFENCTGLKSVIMGVEKGVSDNGIYIGQRVFLHCVNIHTVFLGPYVNSVGAGAFMDLWNLKNLTLADGVKTINEGAFRNCSGLTSVVIPATVTSIGSYAFRNCSNLKNATYWGAANPGTSASDVFDNCTVLQYVCVIGPEPATVTLTGSYYNGGNVFAGYRGLHDIEYCYPESAQPSPVPKSIVSSSSVVMPSVAILMALVMAFLCLF